jgi:cytochrome P450
MARDHFIKKGPVMRAGPNRLIFATAQACHDIYNNPRFIKANCYNHAAEHQDIRNVFDTLDPEVHSAKRKVIGGALSERSMRKFEPEMAEKLNTFLRLLAQAADEERNFDMSVELDHMAFDIVSLLAFGTEVKTMTEPTNRHLIDAQMFGVFLINLKMMYPWLAEAGLPQLLDWIAPDAKAKYMSTLNKMIEARVARGKDARYDLYSIAAGQMSSKADKNDNRELWAEALFFLPAGADTVATLMSGLFFYLATNPGPYKRLAEEIRSTFKSPDELKLGPTLNSCKYLRACIDEALRMTPPASGMFWRVDNPKDKAANEPVIVDGHVLPPGTEVSMSTYAVLHDEKYYPRPYDYIPERWLDEEHEITPSKEQRKAMNLAFVPFSLGSRACAGKAMAYAESSLVVAKILYYFDFDMAPGPEGELGRGKKGMGLGRENPMEYQLYDIFGAKHFGPNLRFRKRGDEWKKLFQEA